MDPIVSGALKAVSVLKGFYDAQRLRQQLDTIESTMLAVGVRMDEVLAVDVRAAYRHLEAAGMATNEQFRRDELRLARGCFARMTERPMESLGATSRSGLLTPVYQELASEWVAAVGHAGNFHYMLLSDEPTLALREAYLCCAHYPPIGVLLFPVELFSQDYRPAARMLLMRSERRDQARQQHRGRELAAKHGRAEYYREMAWKVPLAGAVFLGSLAAGAVSPSLAAQAPLRAAGILQGMGRKSLSDLPLAVPKLNLGADATDPPELVALMRQVSEESTQRLRQLDDSA